MKLLEVNQNNEFEIAHKCECGALFVANERDLFIEHNSTDFCDYTINIVCPWCNSNIRISANRVEPRVLKTLLDNYIDDTIIKKREK